MRNWPPFSGRIQSNLVLAGPAGVDDLALQLLFLTISESMGNHDSKIVDADSVD
jgi:hypothetical protein